MVIATGNTALNISEIKSHLNIANREHGQNAEARAQFGEWEIIVSKDMDMDSDCYVITFKKPYKKGTVTIAIPFTYISDNWLEDIIHHERSGALGALGALEPRQGRRMDLMNVRKHGAFDAAHIKTLRGHKIYQRTLLGEPIDWAIVSPAGITYHCTQYNHLIRGLYTKIRESAKTKTKTKTNSKYEQELGFWEYIYDDCE